MLSERCRRGHLFNEKNTLFRVRGEKTWRTCRKCSAMHKRLRYQNNLVFREQKKARERLRHQENKELRT